MTQILNKMVIALIDLGKTQKQLLEIQKKILKEMEYSNGRTEFREDDCGCN